MIFFPIMEHKRMEWKWEMTFVSAVLQLQAGTAKMRKVKMGNTRRKYALYKYALQFQKYMIKKWQCLIKMALMPVRDLDDGYHLYIVSLVSGMSLQDPT